MIRLEMKNYNTILTEKLPKYLNKYEYLTGKGILPSNQKQMIQHAKFTYSPFGKAFEKQTKTIEDPGEKQIDALKDLKDTGKKKYMLMIIRINY